MTVFVDFVAPCRLSKEGKYGEHLTTKLSKGGAGCGRGRDKPQLYNLEKDPKELTDVAGRYSQVARQMSARMKEYIASGQGLTFGSFNAKASLDTRDGGLYSKSNSGRQELHARTKRLHFQVRAGPQKMWRRNVRYFLGFFLNSVRKSRRDAELSARL